MYTFDDISKVFFLPGYLCAYTSTSTLLFLAAALNISSMNPNWSCGKFIRRICYLHTNKFSYLFIARRKIVLSLATWKTFHKWTHKFGAVFVRPRSRDNTSIQPFPLKRRLIQIFSGTVQRFRILFLFFFFLRFLLFRFWCECCQQKLIIACT